MAVRSKISTMPKAMRIWLEQALAENGFAQFELLSELLKNKGFEISKSSIGRFSKKYQSQLETIKTTTHAAQAIEQAAKDEGNSLSGAVMSMIQSQSFEMLVNMQAAVGEKDESKRLKLLAQVGRDMAQMSRAQQSQKVFAQEQKAKIEQRMKALETEAGKPNSGIDLATLKRVTAEVYGILK